MNFEEDLRSAWMALAPPPRSAITEHVCPECEEIRDAFAGRLWTDLTDMDALRYHSLALSLFAPAAYLYYLPAFMRATLREPTAAGYVPEAIVSTIALEFGVASCGRLELFSPSQRAVLARFLRALPSLNLASGEDVVTLAESLLL